MADNKVTKHAGGRPTHYSDEICRQAREYLGKYSELGHAVPSIAGLSTYLKRSRTLLHDWAADADKQEFKDILSEILAEQEQVTLSNGLKGDFNATIAKLLLGKHGYSDKAETQTTVTLENMSDDELNARIQSLLK